MVIAFFPKYFQKYEELAPRYEVFTVGRKKGEENSKKVRAKYSARGLSVKVFRRSFASLLFGDIINKFSGS